MLDRFPPKGDPFGKRRISAKKIAVLKGTTPGCLDPRGKRIHSVMGVLLRLALCQEEDEPAGVTPGVQGHVSSS